jgi:exodeoxyribonuclease V alpha subunit
VSVLSPTGTAKGRFLAAANDTDRPPLEADQRDPAYLGWEIGRCAEGLDTGSRRALEALAAACVASMRAGSTRLPLDGRLGSALALVAREDSLSAVRGLVDRARAGDAAARAVLGGPGDRTPMVVEGDWLYAERMRVLEERFCARVRQRLAQPIAVDTKALQKALKGVGGGPPPLTDEQKRAVRAALTAPLALITGGPGTGKTTIVVALLRALWWTGVPMESVAIAAPTGKAAQRLKQAIAAGLGSAVMDIAEAGLRSIAPEPQTIHRLLGWSPTRGRFARHENDPLPHRVVIVDEASMIDLAAMDRLLRALREGASVLLLGDADQLPSVEAGAVFRDLCAGLGATRLTTNLRVARDPGGQRLVEAAAAVNAGAVDARFSAAVVKRRTVDELEHSGVEHLDGTWAALAEPLLEAWWKTRVASLDDFARRASRVFSLREGAPLDEDLPEIHALVEHHARSRILCATRGRAFSSGAEAINDALLARLRGGARPRRWRRPELAPGTPVVFERNDYERRLFNGDQGIVLRAGGIGGDGEGLVAVFPRSDRFVVFPVDSLAELSPAFAMTVHKAQGSEFDHVALVLPEVDMPLLTRELLYTAMTRARRSAVLVGEAALLARAVSRTLERHSGVAERLANPAK